MESDRSESVAPKVGAYLTFRGVAAVATFSPPHKNRLVFGLVIVSDQAVYWKPVPQTFKFTLAHRNY